MRRMMLGIPFLAPCRLQHLLSLRQDNAERGVTDRGSDDSSGM
jgi:hypothetical protein